MVRGDQAGKQAEPHNRSPQRGRPRPQPAEGRWAAAMGGAGGSGRCRAGLAPRRLLSGHGACSLAQAPGSQPLLVASAGLDCHSCDAWADPGPFHDWLGPLTGLPSLALTAEELKYADIHNIGAMIAPLHFLEVKLGKRPQPVRSERDEEEERRKRRWGKNKVAAAPCRNKKKVEGFLQPESEWLELMNAKLKTQMEELKQEWKQLILMLNWHLPTCIIRTNSVKTPDSEGNPLLEQLEKK
ncbi:hypothetical protein QTO34_009288 [Cnephaeus nilssonii]|uniref:BZIP domain-containing protein n=1 Tax=Cnephaeus nilssonii TaxID=3371016 RepID=A0AA40LFY3_CNENI|nr:hypothetical protein QTO34_009288 [Eptesicus nilssonii]